MERVERLRQICLDLPGTSERISHGEPTWFVGNTPKSSRAFVMFADRHHDDRVAFWCATEEGMQSVLIENEADQFFYPPYVGGRGWVGVYLDTDDVDWERISEVVEDAFRVIAPKRQIEKVDRIRHEDG